MSGNRPQVFVWVHECVCVIVGVGVVAGSRCMNMSVHMWTLSTTFFVCGRMSRAKEPAYDGCHMIGQPTPQTGTVPHHHKGFLCSYDEGDDKNFVYAYETPLAPLHPLAPPTHTLLHLTWQLDGVWSRSSKGTSSISKNKKILRVCYIVNPCTTTCCF